MFVKKSFIDEIASSLEQNMIALAEQPEQLARERRAKVVEYLTIASGLLDQAGLEKEAAVVTYVLKKIANDPSIPNSTQQAEKNMKERGSMFNGPKPDKSDSNDFGKPATNDPALPHSSEQALKNLEEKGWVFNVGDDDVSVKPPNEDELEELKKLF